MRMSVRRFTRVTSAFLEETGESWREIAEIDVTCVIDRARTRALAQERAT
jgi:hypothetical protein